MILSKGRLGRTLLLLAAIFPALSPASGHVAAERHEVASLKTHSAQLGDRVGYAVALDGSTLIVGRPSANYDLEPRPGRAEIYVGHEASWREQATLAPPNGGEPGSLFGYAVDIDGDTVVIGAPREGPDAGAAYIYERRGSSWAYEATLRPPGDSVQSYFGMSVAIDGEDIAIGSPGRDTAAGDEAGAVLMFQRTGEDWILTTILQHSSQTRAESFGFSVDVTDGLLAAGAPFRSIGPDNNVGTVAVFRASQDAWIEEGTFTSPTLDIYSGFGMRVVIDGRRILVGAPLADHGATSESGAVFVAEQSPEWSVISEIRPTPAVQGTWFGASIASNGRLVVIGAPWSAINGIPATGATYVYTIADGKWNRLASLTRRNASQSDKAGTSVLIERDTVIVGIPGSGSSYNPSTGAAYVFSADMIAPTLEIFDSGSILINISGVESDSVAGTTRDAGWGIESVVVTFDATTPSSSFRNPAQLGCYRQRRFCSWTAHPPTTPGIYRMVVVSTDGAGNYVESAPRDVIVIGSGIA